MKHPLQTLIVNDNGVFRFRANQIVRYVIGDGIGQRAILNDLATRNFSPDDWEQLSQLLGNSLADWLRLPYVSDEARQAADRARNLYTHLPKKRSVVMAYLPSVYSNDILNARLTLRATLEAEGFSGTTLALIMVRHPAVKKAIEVYQHALYAAHAAQMQALEASMGEPQTPEQE